MSPRTLCTRAFLLAGFVAFSLFSGCSDTTEPEPEPDPEDLVNPDKPNSNVRIVSEAVIGDAGKWSTLWEVDNHEADGYLFRGGYNNYYGVGRLTGVGDVPWFYRTGYSPGDVCALSQTSVVPNGVLTIGPQDTDGDGENELGYISLVSPSGSLLDQLVYSADTADVRVNSIVHVADSTFLATGGVRVLAVEYPFVATVALNSAGQLEKRQQSVIHTLPGRYFSRPVLDPSLPVGSEWSFFVASRSPAGAYAVHKVTVAWPSLTPVTIEWSRDITVVGALNPWMYALRFFDGDLYWVGGADDPAKEPRPTGGGYWDSAVAGSITSTGQPRWATLVKTTGHTEGFYQFVANAGSIYAMGSCAEFDQKGQDFGYGWICQMTTTTGSVVSSMTFGNPGYSSGFNDGILDGSTIHCVGWTRGEVGGVYQGWFCEVDISSAFFGGLSAAPARVEASDGEISITHTSGGFQ